MHGQNLPRLLGAVIQAEKGSLRRELEGELMSTEAQSNS